MAREKVLFNSVSKLLSSKPLHRAVMDGIDMDIEHGSYKYYPEFITELHRLMDADSSKSYLITGAPQCPFPDKYLGPVKPGTGLYRKKLVYYYYQIVQEALRRFIQIILTYAFHAKLL